MVGREPNTSRNSASRASRWASWLARIAVAPWRTTSAAAARMASSQATARAAGMVSGSAVSSPARHAAS